MKRGKLPKWIKLGPIDLRVRRSKDTELYALRGLMGQYDGKRGVLRLSLDLPPDVERETFMHELLHAVFDQNGLAHEWGEEVTESATRRTSPVLLALLRDNPKLIAFLMKR